MKLFRTLFLAALMAIGMFVPRPAKAQTPLGMGGSAGTVTSLLTNVMPVTTSATTNIVGPVALTLRKNQGVAVFAKVGTTNLGVNTSNIGIGFAVTADGTNYTHSPYLWLVGAANGTNAGVFATNFPPTLLNNFQGLKALTVTNANTNSFWFTNLAAVFF